MEVAVNFWGVLAAAASAMVIGSIWFSPALFSKQWIKLARIDTSINRGSVLKPMAISAVVNLLTAYVLAHVAYLSNQFFSNSFLQDALTTAFWMWLGFSAARYVTYDAFEGRPYKLTLITIGNELVTFMAMGLVIGLIGY